MELETWCFLENISLFSSEKVSLLHYFDEIWNEIFKKERPKILDFYSFQN